MYPSPFICFFSIDYSTVSFYRKIVPKEAYNEAFWKGVRLNNFFNLFNNTFFFFVFPFILKLQHIVWKTYSYFKMFSLINGQLFTYVKSLTYKKTILKLFVKESWYLILISKCSLSCFSWQMLPVSRG